MLWACLANAGSPTDQVAVRTGARCQPCSGLQLRLSVIVAMSIKDNPKKRGRPYTGGRGTMIGVRLPPDQLAALDTWVAQQPRPLTRPQAIRLMVQAALTAEVEDE